jgi:hypothetical protein
MEYVDRITLLDRHQVIRRLGIGICTFRKLARSGQFPRALERSKLPPLERRDRGSVDRKESAGATQVAHGARDHC